MTYTIPSYTIQPGSVYQPPGGVPGYIKQNARALHAAGLGTAFDSTKLLDQSPLHLGARRAGQQGRCYLYDGTDDYSALDSEITASGDFSLSWNMNATSFATAFHVFYRSSNDRIYFNNGGNFNITANSLNKVITVSPAIVAGTNYKLCLVRLSDTLTLYVNGVAQADTEVNANDFKFNQIGTASSFKLNAAIFDVRYFTKALTASEVQFVNTFGESGDDPSLPIHWWKCDEQSGLIGYDCVGGNNLTHTNITAGNFHTTQDVYSFQNQVGYNNGVNLIYHSEDLTNSVWAFSNTGSTRIANQTTAPNGELTADLVTEDGSTGNHTIWNYKNYVPNPFVNGGEYTFSIYLKSNGRDTLRISYPSYSIPYVNIDLSAGTSTGGTLTPLENGWFRYIFDYIHGAQSVFTLLFNLTNPAGTISYTGDGVSGLYMWGAQLQLGGISDYQKTGANYTAGQFIPRDESDPTNDVLGNPLSYTGTRPNDAALINSSCLTADGTLYIAAAHLTGTETVVRSGGTSTPSISAGRIDLTAGTCWDLLLSDGTYYPLADCWGTAISNAAVDGDDGVLTNATLASAWGAAQDVFHYNILNGFSLYEHASTAAIRVPFVNGSPRSFTPPAGYTLTAHYPAGSHPIPAETEINFNPDSTPEMGGQLGSYTAPAAHAFGDDIDPGATDQGFARQATGKEDRFAIFAEAQTGGNLTTIERWVS